MNAREFLQEHAPYFGGELKQQGLLGKIIDLMERYKESVPLGGQVMQWRTRDEKPLPDKRILIFSPDYPEESGMRKRIIDSQFLRICKDATHWKYISEPSA